MGRGRGRGGFTGGHGEVVTGAPVAAGRSRAPRGVRALPPGSRDDDDRWSQGGPLAHGLAVFPFCFNYFFSIICLIFANFKTGP